MIGDVKEENDRRCKRREERHKRCKSEIKRRGKQEVGEEELGELGYEVGGRGAKDHKD
jgi:hypothetical protein